MIQTEQYGTPLASALRVLSAEFRNERMMRAEEKAARLPAIMTVPLILFILPMLFIVILGPAACCDQRQLPELPLIGVQVEGVPPASKDAGGFRLCWNHCPRPRLLPERNNRGIAQ